MKPNFALMFTDDGIGLMHRTARGWLVLGETRIDDPALAENLGYLRSTAMGLEPNGISTVLVLPDAQVLYTTVETSGPDGAKRRAQIRRALEGRTPYALDELVFDWASSGSVAQVAVIARETLQEAEAFAQEHRFNPVCFTANPDPAMFSGTPYFGPADAVANLPAPDRPERDKGPMVIVGDRALTRRVVPAPEPSAPGAAPEAEAAAEPVFAAAGAEQVPDRAVASAMQDGAAHGTGAQHESVAHEAVNAAMAAGADAPLPEQVPVPSVAPAVPVIPSAAVYSTLPEAAAMPGPVAVEPIAVEAIAVETVPEAPAMFDVPQDEGEPEPDPAGATALPAPAFSSRRDNAARNGMAGAENRLSSVISRVAFAADPVAGTAAPMESLPQAGGRPAAGAALVTAAVTAPDLPPASGIPVLAAPPRAMGKTAGNGRVADPRGKLNGKAASPAPAAGGIARFVPLKQKAGQKAQDKAAQVAAMTAAIAAPSKMPPADLAARAAFGAKVAPQRGKPRHLGLMLTLALVALLAAAAFWATYLTDQPASTGTALPLTGSENAQGLPAAVVAAQVAAPASPDAVAAVTGSNETAGQVAEAAVAPAADGAVQAAAPEPVLADSIAAPQPLVQQPAETALPTQTAKAEPLPEPPGPVAAAPAAADPALAETVPGEPEPAGPPPLAAEDTAALAAQAQGSDNTPALTDAAAIGGTLSTSNGPAPLPQTVTAQTDARPQTPLPPAPFGTFFDRDANGLVIATPDGALTPEGALVIAGRPALVPPARSVSPQAVLPLAPDPALALVAPVQALPDAAAESAAVPVADPALAGFRPRPRPATLAGPQDDTLLTVEPLIATAGTVRPKSRPQDRMVAATAPVAPVENADAPLLASASRLAVDASRRPAARPRDFSAGVAAALAAVAPDAQPAVQLASVAVPAPRPAKPAPAPEPAAEPDTQAGNAAVAESDAEPELASAAPAIPTKASVAKQATERNAINLSKLNLIGVYGSTSDRRALVRLATGKYVRLKVGDRVDGGKVAAIGAQEVRYVKNGRNLVLALPKEG